MTDTLAPMPARSLPAALLGAVGVICVVAWKEIRTYFSSFLAYVLTFVTLWIVWDRFILILAIMTQDVRLEQLIAMLPQVFLFTVPLIAMRLFSEERSTGTIELLLSSPVTEWQVVLGKFLGSLAMLTVMVGATLHLPWIVTRHGAIDLGPLKATYMATMLVGASFLAIGMCMSALSESQVVAAFLTFGALVALLFVGSWGQNTSSTFLGIEWSKVFTEVAIFGHLERMTSGEIHTKALVYYGSFIFFFLYCTVKTVESRRWR